MKNIHEFKQDNKFQGMPIGALFNAPVQFTKNQMPNAELAWELRNSPNPRYIVLAVRNSSQRLAYQFFYPPNPPSSSRFWASSVSYIQSPGGSTTVDGIRIA